MMYALQDKLETRPREALSLLFEAISRIWSKIFQRSQLPKLQALLHKALLMTSIHFPGAQHDIIQHLMHHIVDGIETSGHLGHLPCGRLNACGMCSYRRIIAQSIQPPA